MAKVEIDNKKMWESLRDLLLERGSYTEAACIDFALEKQGLTIRNGEIVSIEPEPSTEKEIPYKPKYQAGDWIQIEQGHVMKIVDVDKELQVYHTLSWCGTKNIRSMSDINCISHLWTIQDAKDGDVLVGEYDNCKKPWIGIFKCISKHRPETQFDSYCFINSSHHKFTTPECKVFPAFNPCCGHTSRYAKPATKEQRDLLFTKMHEAGYEWNAEKKELKKIPIAIFNDSVTTLEPKQELTEFEEELANILIYREYDGPTETEEDIDNAFSEFGKITKQYSQKLLFLAHKQIASEIDIEDMVEEKKDSLNLEKDAYFAFGAYRQGIEDTLKAIKGK